MLAYTVRLAVLLSLHCLSKWRKSVIFDVLRVDGDGFISRRWNLVILENGPPPPPARCVTSCFLTLSAATCYIVCKASLLGILSPLVCLLWSFFIRDCIVPLGPPAPLPIAVEMSSSFRLSSRARLGVILSKAPPWFESCIDYSC